MVVLIYSNTLQSVKEFLGLKLPDSWRKSIWIYTFDFRLLHLVSVRVKKHSWSIYFFPIIDLVICQQTFCFHALEQLSNFLREIVVMAAITIPTILKTQKRNVWIFSQIEEFEMRANICVENRYTRYLLPLLPQ